MRGNLRRLCDFDDAPGLPGLEPWNWGELGRPSDPADGCTRLAGALVHPLKCTCGDSILNCGIGARAGSGEQCEQRVRRDWPRYREMPARAPIARASPQHHMMWRCHGCGNLQHLMLQDGPCTGNLPEQASWLHWLWGSQHNQYNLCSNR